MTHSMTGFASAEGHADGWTWSWDLRAVNGRGLDIRLRLPDWLDGVEAPARAALQKAATRGNVTLNLRMIRDAGPTATGPDNESIAAAVKVLTHVEALAAEGGLTLRPSSAAELLSMRGIFDSAGAQTTSDTLRKALLDSLDTAIAAFRKMRAREGAALAKLLTAQVDTIERLTNASRALIQTRADHMAAALKTALSRVTDNADANPDRVAQELAMIAVKADITEELDRLDAHVAAARELLTSDEPKGRKLDFLTQEFNREANTLCSKAQFSELTRLGLDLKHTIDQMREQVQNVE